MKSIIDRMRELGIRQLSLELSDGFASSAPPAEADEPEAEQKSAGICIYPGCGEKAGWSFARQYCREHGLSEAGVK